MDKLEINNEVILLAHEIKRSKLYSIQHLTRLKLIAEKSGDKQRSKNFEDQINSVKKADHKKLAREVIVSKKNYGDVPKNGSSDQLATARVLGNTRVRDFVEHFRAEHSDWEKWLPSIMARWQERSSEKKMANGGGSAKNPRLPDDDASDDEYYQDSDEPDTSDPEMQPSKQNKKTVSVSTPGQGFQRNAAAKSNDAVRTPQPAKQDTLKQKGKNTPGVKAKPGLLDQSDDDDEEDDENDDDFSSAKFMSKKINADEDDESEDGDDSEDGDESDEDGGINIFNKMTGSKMTSVGKDDDDEDDDDEEEEDSDDDGDDSRDAFKGAGMKRSNDSMDDDDDEELGAPPMKKMDNDIFTKKDGERGGFRGGRGGDRNGFRGGRGGDRDGFRGRNSGGGGRGGRDFRGGRGGGFRGGRGGDRGGGYRGGRGGNRGGGFRGGRGGDRNSGGGDHPSWQAKKQQRFSMSNTSFQGQRKSFNDN